MFKFLRTILRSRAQDTALRTDPEFPAVVAARFSAVIESEGSLFGLDGHGWDAASVPLQRERVACPSNWDWDGGIWLDCPNHTGAFCPGYYTV